MRQSAVDAGKSGEVVLSKEAYSLVKSHVRGMKLDCGDYLALEYVCRHRVVDPVVLLSLLLLLLCAVPLT